ncbi:MAG: hypothetical protein KJN95_04925, partial [Gammaproteobacteria bacterium]|nr:hypothetical protein [Gammaproteobacteria bacterium]
MTKSTDKSLIEDTEIAPEELGENLIEDEEVADLEDADDEDEDDNDDEDEVEGVTSVEVSDEDATESEKFVERRKPE